MSPTEIEGDVVDLEDVRFPDRRAAGLALAAALARHADAHPLVLALPRGGVPVAAEVARALHAPLDVLVVRKLGAPFQPELGLGAIAEGGGRYVDEALRDAVGVTPASLERVAEREALEVARRIARYRGGRPLSPVSGRTVILIDDGVATGGTARAALGVLRALGPRRLILAVPVAPPDTARALAGEADEVVALLMPEALMAIGLWYEDFREVSDEEVTAILGEIQRGEARP